MSNLHKLALSESFHRCPETCPALSEAATKASYQFDRWLDQRFQDKLTEAERSEISAKKTVMVNELVEAAKDVGTSPLRAALVTEIERNFHLNMPRSRIERIEAGEDPEQTLTSDKPSKVFIIPNAYLA